MISCIFHHVFPSVLHISETPADHLSSKMYWFLSNLFSIHQPKMSVITSFRSLLPPFYSIPWLYNEMLPWTRVNLISFAVFVPMPGVPLCLKDWGGGKRSPGATARAPKIRRASGLSSMCPTWENYKRIMLNNWYIGLFWDSFFIDYSYEMY